MDKETLSNYGWIVICVLVLAVMIALATPFGKFISQAVQSTTEGLFGVNQSALGAVNITVTDQKINIPGEEETNAVVGSATFWGYYDYQAMPINDPATLTWDELKAGKDADKYGYDKSAISDTTIGNYAFQSSESLISLTIPNSVTSIGYGAFSNNGTLDITYNGTKTQWNAIKIDGKINVYCEINITCSDGIIQFPCWVPGMEED